MREPVVLGWGSAVEDDAAAGIYRVIALGMAAPWRRGFRSRLPVRASAELTGIDADLASACGSA